MEEKVIKAGDITKEFFHWMEATFGYDVGQFVLVQDWVVKHIPCKFDEKTRCIYDGYYGSSVLSLMSCYKWEILEVENYFMLRLWYRYGENHESTSTYCFLIEKCVRIPRVEQLDLGRFGL